MNCSGDECKCWGTSVWIDIGHVQHAIRVYKAFAKNPIAKLEVTENCGVIKHTGSGPQPEHRSFWRDVDVEFAPKCEIIDPFLGA